MTILYSVDSQQSKPKQNYSEHQLARYLLLRLNPPQKGDLIPIIGTPHESNDLDCIIRWLRENSQELEQPWERENCYERLLFDIEERLYG